MDSGQVMARLFLPMVCLKPAEEEDEPPAWSSVSCSSSQSLEAPRVLEKEPTLAEIFSARFIAREAPDSDFLMAPGRLNGPGSQGWECHAFEGGGRSRRSPRPRH